MSARIMSVVAMVFTLGAAVASQTCAAATTASNTIHEYDTDNDKTLDLAEVKAAASAHFDKLNKDTDGTLDPTEVKGIIGVKAFKAADTDNDGTLSKDEYLSLVERLFNKADVDKDGTLNARELKSRTGQRLQLLIA